MNKVTVSNDLKRNKTISLTLLLFITLSAALSVASVLIAIQTFTSVSNLYKTAQPPHFLQMHKGEINEEQVYSFMAENDLVTYSQIVAMVNIFGENITVVKENESYNLSDLRLDVGLVKQNEKKDLLLNYKHEKVVLNKGEIGIPVILKQMYDLKIGDRIMLDVEGIHKEFIVKEFVLDAQMNSTMASSTRVLLSDADFNDLFGKAGEIEYIIEVYFKDKNNASVFKTAYENAGLPADGQAVTYAMMFLLSALTDLITVFVLFLAGVLLIMVSFICIKYTIMAALEEDVREIGTMKAIGLSFKDIRGIYLNKYRILSVSGVIAGFIIALPGSNLLTDHISITFGKTGLPLFAVILAVAAGCFVYFLINRRCKKILNKIKKITVVDALVTSKGFEKETGKVRDGLFKSKRLSVNWLMGLREVSFKFKNWAIVFMVVLISVIMGLLPMNLLTTFESPEFITYMGGSPADILIEVESGKNLELNYAKVKRLLLNDDTVKNFFESRTVRAKTTDSEGKWMNIDIDVGTGSGSGLKYLSGRAPIGSKEIAISYMNASEMGVSVGNTVKLIIDDRERLFRVSGIYQDITKGGRTAKSENPFNELASGKYSFYVNLKENTDVKVKADEWKKNLGTGITADPMEEFIGQTLGQVTKQLKTMVLVVVLLGVFLIMLITVLFLKLRLAKDLSHIAILKAIGFSAGDIHRQYMIKVGLAAFFGILAGIVATDLLGEKIISFILGMAGLGIKKINLIASPLAKYIVVPVVFMGVILAVTRLVIGVVRRYSIVTVINE